MKARLDTMIEKGFHILVGDANGADEAVQRYFADKSYPHVLVHCMMDHCRNNLGNWPTRQVAAPRGAKGFDYYSLKDHAMAEAAEYGLMLWDGKSKGTINNVLNLSRGNKLVVVYVASLKSFQTVRSSEDFKDLLTKGDPSSVGKLVHELHLDHLQPRAAAGSRIAAGPAEMTERSLQVTYRKGRAFAAYRDGSIARWPAGRRLRSHRSSSRHRDHSPTVGVSGTPESTAREHR